MTAMLSPEPWRNTLDPTFAHNAAVGVPYLPPKKRKQDLTKPRQPRFPQNRGVTRKIPHLPITRQSESRTVSKKAENWDSKEAYKKVANEGKWVSIFEIRKEILKERKQPNSHKICGKCSPNLHI